MIKILVIEDDYDFNATLCDILRFEGYEVFSGHNGLEGITLAFEIIPDLILCDIGLPKMDGNEVFQVMQGAERTALIPFIFLTANKEPHEIRAGMEQGVDDYLTKPVTEKNLLDAVRIRLKKYEKIKTFQDNKLLTLLNNPLNGLMIILDNKIIFSNKEAAYILGYDDKELLHTEFDSLIQEDCVAEAKETIALCLKNETKHSKTSMTFLTKNKSEKQVEISFSRFSYKAKETVILYMVAYKHSADNEAEAENDEEIKEEKGNKSENWNFSERQLDVLKCIVDGLTNTEMAAKLFVSQKTIDQHKGNLLRMTKSKNDADLVRKAIKRGIVKI